MDPSIQKFDKTNVSTYSKTAKNIGALSGKKILAFPSTLGSTTKDEAGNDFAYIIIRINTSDTSSKLREDVGTGDVLVAAGAVGTDALFDGAKLQASVSVLATKRTADQDLISRYGPAVAKENAKGWTKKTGLTKLDKVIVLPMPASHNVVSHINYDTTETSSDFSKALDVASTIGSGDVGGMAAYLGSAMAGIAASAGIGTINSIKKSLGGSGFTSEQSKGHSDSLKKGIQTAARIADNPKKEVLFKDLGFREFRFDYILSPKNSFESTIIQEIIRTLRYYSLPELFGGKLFYTFPAEFEIALMKGGIENPALPRIATCILENVTVNYNSGGAGWGNLPDGLTPQVSLSLSFKELEIIDRSRVWNRDSIITSGY